MRDQTKIVSYLIIVSKCNKICLQYSLTDFFLCFLTEFYSNLALKSCVILFNTLVVPMNEPVAFVSSTRLYPNGSVGLKDCGRGYQIYQRLRVSCLWFFIL